MADELTEAEEVAFRHQLEALLADLDAQDEAGEGGTRPVTLDQTSVGRLSRMDAMQAQAMAQATQARRRQLRQRIVAALARMDEGDYGYCLTCGEPIAKGRLEIDPATATCIAHAR